MKRQKIMAVVVAIMVVSCTVSMTYAAPSVDDKKREQNKNSEKINELQIQNKANNGEMKYLNDEITNLAKQIDGKNKVIGEKERNLKSNENNVIELKTVIADKEDKIKSLEKNIDDKTFEQKEKEVLLGKRLRAIYKGNPYSQMTMFVLESKGISDFISRVENVSRLVNYDKTLINEVNKIREELNSIKNGIENEKNTLEKEKTNLDKVAEELKKEIEELDKAKAELDKVQSTKNSKMNSLSDKNKEIANSIFSLEESNEQLEKDIQDIIAKNTQNNSGNNSSSINNNSSGGNQNHSGKWIYPVSAEITSPFGYRTHPVTGAKKLHTGTDFGASYGTEVKAAGSGKVILASSYGGYGNAVMIDHGNGIVTLYGHNSKLNVSEGQIVQQGQVVSYVGSTGVSTGPHLHLEFRVDGQPVNPMGYLN